MRAVVAATVPLTVNEFRAALPLIPWLPPGRKTTIAVRHTRCLPTPLHQPHGTQLPHGPCIPYTRSHSEGSSRSPQRSLMVQSADSLCMASWGTDTPHCHVTGEEGVAQGARECAGGHRAAGRTSWGQPQTGWPSAAFSRFPGLRRTGTQALLPRGGV